MHEFAAFIHLRLRTLILDFNDQDAVIMERIMDVTTDARAELKKDIID